MAAQNTPSLPELPTPRFGNWARGGLLLEDAFDAAQLRAYATPIAAERDRLAAELAEAQTKLRRHAVADANAALRWGEHMRVAAEVTAERERLQAALLQANKKVNELATSEGTLFRERDRLREEVERLSGIRNDCTALRTLNTKLAQALNALLVASVRMPPFEIGQAAEDNWRHALDTARQRAGAALAKVKP